jgi:hypothetical protein
LLSTDGKARTFKTYIDSEKFGKATWTTIHIFGNNVVQGIDIIKLLFVLIDRIDRNDIRITNASEDHLQRIKQQIYLEIILKLETLIEATLVLLTSLGTGYTKVARDMTHYDIGFVKDVARRFANRNRIHTNMRRALGLANPKKLQLASEERKLLLRVYDHTINFMLDKLCSIANFYQRYQIIYTKQSMD